MAPFTGPARHARTSSPNTDRQHPPGVSRSAHALSGPAEISFGDFRSASGPLGKLVGVFHAYPPHTRGDDLGTLAALVADERLTPLLGSVQDWQDLPATLQGLRERRIRGKAVITRS